LIVAQDMARTTRNSAATAAASEKKTQQLSSPPSTPAPKAKSGSKSTRIKQEPKETPASSKKRQRKSIKEEPNDELPHNLSTNLPTPATDAEEDAAPPPKKRTRRTPQKEEAVSEDEAKAVKDEPTESPEISPKKTPKKKETYGLTPGKSPYPDYPRPTPEDCREVVRLLEKVHGEVNVPKTIPPPSLEVAGCGEVPSVIDALVRTRLSANTTNKNSSTAFQGLVARFGTLKEGVGKGSVDWDAVRVAPQREVFLAIERGGLADRKSRDIQAILQLAYEEGQQRRAALEGSGDGPAGAENEPQSEKQDEIAKAKQNVISLDHIHLLSTEDAITKMLSYPGIGPKTASCVALFCLQRPSFAVDTHVFRLCQYLGWMPKSPKKGQPKVDRNTTFSHCDVRIPDEYKYALHYLLIKHGKTCPRCRAVTGQSSAGWEEGCPIEHLVKRHGSKKGGMSAVDRKKAAKAAGIDEDEVEMEDAVEGADGSDSEEVD